jgi:hypothetical protein
MTLRAARAPVETEKLLFMKAPFSGESGVV